MVLPSNCDELPLKEGRVEHLEQTSLKTKQNGPDASYMIEGGEEAVGWAGEFFFFCIL